MFSSILGRLWGDLPSSFTSNYTIGTERSDQRCDVISAPEVNQADRSKRGNSSPACWGGCEDPTAALFTLYNGTKRADGGGVSVFILDKKKKDLGSAKLSLARAALQRLKSLRHPYIAKLLEGVEVESGIYIVTERVTPLLWTQLPVDAAWGLLQVTSVLNFLNTDCQLVHGLISPLTVYVTDTGNWKLSCFELCQSFSASPYQRTTTELLNHPNCLRYGAKPTQEQQTGVSSSLWIDRWGLAYLIAWTSAAGQSLKKWEAAQLAAGHTSLVPTSSRSPPSPPGVEVDSVINKMTVHFPPIHSLVGQVSPQIKKIIEWLLSSKTAPADLSLLLKPDSYFNNNPTVKIMAFLETVSLKSVYEREQFFETLPDLLTSLPLQLKTQQLLPELVRAISDPATIASTSPTIILSPILQIAEALNTDAFRTRLLPCLVNLFKSPDRALRFALLQSIALIDTHLDTQTANTSLFEPLCMGFADSSAPLREATLKAMIYFVPKLNRANLDKALRLMAKLLEDSEPAIRTNTLICFARLAQSGAIPKEKAKKILMTAVVKALRDPFVAARIAALQSATVMSRSGVFEGEEVALHVMPHVCRSLVDRDPKVRGIGFSTLEQLMTSVRDDTALMARLSPSDNKSESSEGETQGNQTNESNSRASALASTIGGWGLPLGLSFYKTSGEEGSNGQSTTIETRSQGGATELLTVEKILGQAKQKGGIVHEEFHDAISGPEEVTPRSPPISSGWDDFDIDADADFSDMFADGKGDEFKPATLPRERGQHSPSTSPPKSASSSQQSRPFITSSQTPSPKHVSPKKPSPPVHGLTPSTSSLLSTTDGEPQHNRAPPYPHVNPQPKNGVRPTTLTNKSKEKSEKEKEDDFFSSFGI
eukprot:GHVN01000647.1.p1 GENE.GHVN01000647.1~~GHVN01000647.1.p1  ORF type:complete len:878 (-),score=163.10 GHVN01000647.1:815-3448(-)